MIKNKDYTILLDLDDTVCAFSENFIKWFGTPIRELEKKVGREKIEKMINSASTEFWSNMNFLEGGKDLYYYLKSNFEQVIFLSSPGPYKDAIQGKNIFLEREFEGNYLAIFDKNKYKYAGLDKILIDDYDKNLKLFREHGGLAIKFENNKQVIQELEKIIQRGN